MKHTYIMIATLFTIFIGLMSCNGSSNTATSHLTASNQQQTDTLNLAKAVFASGCFWCTEAVFERVEGVRDVISGYAGGTKVKPTYEEVSSGRSDHAEAVIVYYDSTEISYHTLLDVFFHSHDPTQLNRQGPDVGKQYRSSIFYNSQYQNKLALEYLQQLDKRKEFSKPVVTEIKPLSKFWPAEDYHQDYYKLNPDNPYIRTVSMPKVKKFEKEYKRYLKQEYQ